MPDLNLKIGFIGAGNMGQAMIGALIASDCSAASDIFVCDVVKKQTDRLAATYGISVAAENSILVKTCDVVIFAVKPQTIETVLSDLKDREVFSTASRKKILISIAAGIPIKKLESYVYSDGDPSRKKNMPILRVMPNTPALVLAGVSGLCGNGFAVPEDMAVARKILSAMGTVFECEEKEMDAVTAVSGSGPAYCFYLAEAMTAAAHELGFSDEDASAMTTATLKGAVALMESQPETAADLRKRVTSPGGTTEAAIRVLDDHRVKQAIIAAVTAAARRSRELSA